MGVNTPSGANFALVVDEGISCGNTEDTFGRHAQHVKVGNKLSEPIPVYQVSDTPGLDKREYQEAVTPGGAGTTPLISLTVPALKTWSLQSATVSCGWDCCFVVKINGVKIETVRTSPGAPSYPHIFTPRVSIIAGDTVTIDAVTSAYVPAVSVNSTLYYAET